MADVDQLQARIKQLEEENAALKVRQYPTNLRLENVPPEKLRNSIQASLEEAVSQHSDLLKALRASFASEYTETLTLFGEDLHQTFTTAIHRQSELVEYERKRAALHRTRAAQLRRARDTYRAELELLVIENDWFDSNTQAQDIIDSVKRQLTAFYERITVGLQAYDIDDYQDLNEVLADNAQGRQLTNGEDRGLNEIIDQLDESVNTLELQKYEILEKDKRIRQAQKTNANLVKELARVKNDFARFKKNPLNLRREIDRKRIAAFVNRSSDDDTPATAEDSAWLLEYCKSQAIELERAVTKSKRRKYKNVELETERKQLLKVRKELEKTRSQSITEIQGLTELLEEERLEKRDKAREGIDKDPYSVESPHEDTSRIINAQNAQISKFRSDLARLRKQLKDTQKDLIATGKALDKANKRAGEGGKDNSFPAYNGIALSSTPPGADLAAVNAELAEAKNDLAAAVDENYSLMDQIEDLQDRLRECKEGSKHTVDDSANHQIIRELATALDRADEKASTLERKYEELRELTRINDEQLSVSIGRVAVLTEEINDLKAALEEREKRKTRSKSKSAGDGTEALEAALEQARDELRTVKSGNETLKEQAKELREKARSPKPRTGKKGAEKAHSEDNPYQEELDYIRELEESLEMAQMERDDVGKRNVANFKSNPERYRAPLQAEITRLTDELEKVKDQLTQAEINYSKDKDNKTGADLEECEERVQKLTRAVTRAQRRQQRAEEDAERVGAVLLQADADFDNQKALAKEAERNAKEANKKSVDDANRELAEARKDVQNLQKKYDDEKIRTERLREERDRLRKERDETLGRGKSSKSQVLRKVRVERDMLRTEVDEVTEKLQEGWSAGAVLLQTELEALQAHCAALRDLIANGLRYEVRGLLEQVADAAVINADEMEEEALADAEEPDNIPDEEDENFQTRSDLYHALARIRRIGVEFDRLVVAAGVLKLNTGNESGQVNESDQAWLDALAEQREELEQEYQKEKEDIRAQLEASEKERARLLRFEVQDEDEIETVQPRLRSSKRISEATTSKRKASQNSNPPWPSPPKKKRRSV